MKNANMKKIDLDHNAYGVRSLYGKAYALEGKRGKFLFSYGTLVAVFCKGKFVRVWNGYSATTMRHINAFRDYCGLGKIGKAEWDGMDCKAVAVA